MCMKFIYVTVPYITVYCILQADTTAHRHTAVPKDIHFDVAKTYFTHTVLVLGGQHARILLVTLVSVGTRIMD